MDTVAPGQVSGAVCEGPKLAEALDLDDLARRLAAHERMMKRRRRYELGGFQRRSTKLRAVRLCGTAVEDTVTIGVEAQEAGPVAHVSGIARCGSPWACPICAPVVRERRAREIDDLAAAALALGWGVLMVSCTVPHAYSDSLAATFETLRSAHAKTRCGRPFRTLRDALDYAGAVRCWEMTLGLNGWHPHSHELLFFRRQLDDGDVAQVLDHYRSVYGGAVEAATGKALHPVHGVDVRRVSTAREVGSYLTKVDGGWGAGLEIARADLKRSRGGRNPWDLLSGAVDGEVGCLAAWREYEAATAGKRAVQFSRGLRAELGLGEAVTDEEAAVVEPEAGPVYELEVTASQWADIRREGAIAYLLEECEDRAGRSYGPDSGLERCGAGP